MKNKNTRAQELGITEFPYTEYDPKGNCTYQERSNGYWERFEHNDLGDLTYFENSEGDWIKTEYNSKGDTTSFENNNGYWFKAEYDLDGNQISRTGSGEGGYIDMFDVDDDDDDEIYFEDIEEA